MASKRLTRCDYLVCTAILDGAGLDAINTLARMLQCDKHMRMYGYDGVGRRGAFVGDDGNRMLLSVAGADADTVLGTFDVRMLTGLSIARLDLQMTIPVADPDAVIIGMRPSKMYKSTLTYSVYGTGATMYVGAPSSRARLRVYNKTAQSGQVAVDGRHLLRVELQLRNEYADRALFYVGTGTVDQYYMYHVKRMADAYVVAIVERAIGEGVTTIVIDEPDADDQIARRKRWLEETVAPSLRKLLLIDPEYVKQLLASVLDEADSKPYDESE